MRLKEFVLGRRVALYSSLPKSEVERKIKKAAGSPFSPFHHGITGGVFFGKVRLAWSNPMFGNGFRPVFSGRVAERNGRTELKAGYGAPFFLLAFLTLWYGFLALIALSLISIVATDGQRTDNEWMGAIIVPLFIAVPVIFHFVLNRRADEHFDEIIDFLQREGDMIP